MSWWGVAVILEVQRWRQDVDIFKVIFYYLASSRPAREPDTCKPVLKKEKGGKKKAFLRNVFISSVLFFYRLSTIG